MSVHLERVLRHAERKLVPKPNVRLSDLIDIYRRFLKLEEHVLKQEHEYGEAGLGLVKKRADLVTVLMRHLWTGAWESNKLISLTPLPRMALLAVGGFGRGELNPYSDIDIVFLYANTQGERPKQVDDIIQEILYMLWDIGFQVGPATRTMDEMITQANADLRTKTSLLETRYLCGDEELFHEYSRSFERRCLLGKETEYLQWRLADQADRHTKSANTVYLQEPNVKTGCGGLRDYHNLLWVAQVKRGLTSTQAMVEAKLLTPTERKQLDQAYDFLLRLRTELHYQQKRSGDILTLRLQGQIANAFNYQHRSILRRTEALMRHYYEHASLLYTLGNEVSNRLCGKRSTTSLAQWAFLPFRATKPEEIDGFLLQDGVLYPHEGTVFGVDPLRLVRVFLIAQQHDAKISPEIKIRIRRRLYMVTRSYIYQQAVREVILSIFSRKGQVGRILRAMHEVGLLGRLFPEFRTLTCLVQHEFFHRYTADEHTLVCIEVIDKILDATEPPHAKYRPLLQQAARPHLLYLAMLLHDTGKSENGKHHAEASAVNAVRVARRLKLSPNELSTLVFLVDHHMTMSEIARRKNLDDETTIVEFARIVQSQERLDLLMLLTFCDVLGTGATRSYSDWKDLLLWQLYHRTSSALSGVAEFIAAADAARQEIQERVIAELGREIDLGEVVAHFQNSPKSYVESTPEDLIKLHIKVTHNFLQYQISQEGVTLEPIIHWRDFPEQGYSEVTVVTWDRDRIFARITGSLAACGLTILKADIFTRTDDIALETLFVATDRLEAVTDVRDKKAFEKILFQELGASDFDLAPVLARRRKPRPSGLEDSEVPTRVTIDLHASPTQTVLDVQTADYPGLLYRIAGELAENNFDVSTARITTEKGAALDTFYLTDAEGQKVVDQDRLNHLVEEIKKRIAED